MAGYSDPLQYEERLRQLPITVPNIVLAVMGVATNAHALHILRKYYGVNSSSYTVILTYLVVVDLTGCIGMLSMEVRERMENPLILPYKNGFIVCSVSHFLGHTIASWSMWIVVLISYDRFRAICFPFRAHLSITRVHLMCLGVGCASSITAAPVIYINGVRSFSFPDFQNGTQCGVKDAMKGSYMPTVYYAILTGVFVAMVAVVGWFYYNIRRALRVAQKAKLMESVYAKGKYALHAYDHVGNA